MINRIFNEIEEHNVSKADQQDFLVSMGWSRGDTWEKVLKSKRILIISPAGSGKTHECRDQAKRLWDEGEPSFFVELSVLAMKELRYTLDDDEVTRLDEWASSQSGTATFFLDSIDELRLTLGSFEQALKNLKRAIGNKLGRVRIVVTTRPIVFDHQLIRKHLPVPFDGAEFNADTFAEIAMGKRLGRSSNEEEKIPDWRTLALMPLSDKQMVEFALLQGLSDPQPMIDDLYKQNLKEFARSPQELIGITAVWQDNTVKKTRSDQVAAGIRLKLKARIDRAELAELSMDKAFEGACQIALAMLTTRRLTIGHNPKTIAGDPTVFDPTELLSNWTANELLTLLERPLFGFAGYHRVRFHHRSIIEYLASQRLLTLRQRGMSFRMLQTILFTETRGITIVRPSMRPTAAWIAAKDSGVFQLIRDHDPAVLLNEGDPEQLTPLQRREALTAYVKRYGKGTWRGQEAPTLQVHRFACKELGTDIPTLWNTGIENAEVRHLLLQLIGISRISSCADIVYESVVREEITDEDRLVALIALVEIEHTRLIRVINDVVNFWPNRLAKSAVSILFPMHISIDQLCFALKRLEYKENVTWDITWELPRQIKMGKFDLNSLERLRDGLYALILSGTRANEDWPYIVCDYSYLCESLAAVCVEGLRKENTNTWYKAAFLALRCRNKEHSQDEAHKDLTQKINNLAAEQNELFFWTCDNFLQSFHHRAEPWKRLMEIINVGAVSLSYMRDFAWLMRALLNIEMNFDTRRMLLEAVMRIPPDASQWKEHLEKLKVELKDEIELLSVVDENLKNWTEHEELNKKYSSTKRDAAAVQRAEKDRESWVNFWQEVSQNSNLAFSPENYSNTVINLCKAMQRDRNANSNAGWNRGFIEGYFNKATADKLRLNLMQLWRSNAQQLEDLPTMSLRTANQELALMGLYAEAEDGSWATKLTQNEAKFACEISLTSFHEVPVWLESLIDCYPKVVETVIAHPLIEALPETNRENIYLSFLRNIQYASPKIGIYLSQYVLIWLERNGNFPAPEGEAFTSFQSLKSAIAALLVHGDAKIKSNLINIANVCLKENPSDEIKVTWAATLLKLNAEQGLQKLEDILMDTSSSERISAIIWFANLFGHRQGSINLNEFPSQTLLKLLKLSYTYVKREDDIHREGTYIPDDRDDAESGRNVIVNAILRREGIEGWNLKNEMANDPLCAHFRDRILFLADEQWALEIDAMPYTPQQAISLDRTGQTLPMTNQAMFAMMNDRIDDISSLLLQDFSPREQWQAIKIERVMRRAIALVLNDLAKGNYIVIQENVTADEKETDLRLRSIQTEHEAVIELKVAEQGWSARALIDTIKMQLVDKYMALDTRRSGCLLITVASDRTWKHPDTGSTLNIAELISLLNIEAKRIETLHNNSIQISIYILDLRPRLK